jgi:hypothetical protein
MKIAVPWIIAVCSLAFAIYLTFGNVQPELPAGLSQVAGQGETEPDQQTQARLPLPPAIPATTNLPADRKAPTPELPNATDPVQPATPCPETKLCPFCPPANHAGCATASDLQSCEKKVAQCESWDPIVTDSILRQSILSARQATLSCLLQDDLELTPEQVQWVSEAACALRELRWHAVDKMHEAEAESDAPRLLIKGDRKEILADMEKLLGTPAYTRLREMGGIGLLNDTLECADQP